jgi:hypothetical protein
MSVSTYDVQFGFSGDDCEYGGCRAVATFKSGCNMRSCPEGASFRKACDTHMSLLCNPVMIEGW